MKYILIVLFCFSISISYSRPISISFDKMMEKSKTIVIAEFLGKNDVNRDSLMFDSYMGGYLLKVISVLKGVVETDTIIVGNGAHGRVRLKENRTYIAFINEHNGFEWYGGASISENENLLENLENALIHIEGFYDFNAYLVYPANHTVFDLKQYIDKGNIENTVSGYIHFYDVKTNSMQPSDMYVSTTYFYSADTSYAFVTDKNIALSDFITDSAKVFLKSWDPTIEIRYKSNLSRSFTLIGELTKKTNSNEIEAMFWVESPEELTETELKNYLKKPALGSPIYEIEMIIDGLEKCSLIISDCCPSVILKIGSQTMEFSSFSSPTTKDEGYIEFDNKTKITLYKLNQNSVMLNYTRESMIRALRSQELKGKIEFSLKSGFKKYSGKINCKLKSTSFSEH